MPKKKSSKPLGSKQGVVETQKFLDSIIENIPDMIFVKEAKDLRFVRFNKAGEKLLGFKMKDLMGKNDYDFFPKDQADFFIAHDRAVLEHKKLVDIPEEPIDTKSLGKRYLHTKKIPILDEKGKPIFLLGISEDITDKKKMEDDLRVIEELKELDRMKSEFITVAAHQLRTPLSGVKWTINLMLKGDLGPITDEQRTFLVKASESNDRMIQLVNDLLGADKVASGKLHYDFEPLQLLDLIDDLLVEFAPQAAAKNVKFNFPKKPQKLSEIYADEEKIRAAFQNILENALKYSPNGGSVDITILEKDKEVEVSVRDRGIGIPKAQQGQIFQRFFRGANAVKSEASGTGIGLYIVKGIIEKHNGRVWFESEEGKGSTFHFTIPLAPKEDPKKPS
jgi:PAS domain S-box-containing protein